MSKDDAEDLLQFLEAIADYVFVLTAKFDSYMARRAKATGDSSLLVTVKSDLNEQHDGQPSTAPLQPTSGTDETTGD